MPQVPFRKFAECPECREVLELEQEFTHPSNRSYCSWTDGKGFGWIIRNLVGSPYLEDDLYRAPCCGRYFWYSDAVESGDRAKKKAFADATSPNTGDVYFDVTRTELAALACKRAADDL